MNNCSFIGRIANQPELRFTPGNGMAVLKFSLAVNRKFKKDEVDFINIVAFNKTAEIIQSYFKKGDMIALETHVQTGSYNAQDGTKRYTTDFIVDSFYFVGGNKKENNSDSLGIDGAVPEDNGDMPF